MTIKHQQYGHPCPCDFAEVTEREAQFLELMDDWYGDKSYRCHSEWLEILAAVRVSLLGALEDHEPGVTHGADESVGWHAATRFIRDNF